MRFEDFDKIAVKEVQEYAELSVEDRKYVYILCALEVLFSVPIEVAPFNGNFNDNNSLRTNEAKL